MRVAYGLDQRQADAMEGGFLRRMPPDEDSIDLIEWALLDGQIDCFALDLAHIFLVNLARQPSAHLPN